MATRRLFDGAQTEIKSIPLVGTAYKFWIKVSGVWKQATAYIKVSGVWKQATGYINISGVWK